MVDDGSGNVSVVVEREREIQTRIDLRDWGLDVRAQSSTAVEETGEETELSDDVSLFVLLTLLSNRPPLCP